MAENDSLIVIAVGPDSVGLIQKISEFIVQHGCNIEDSKMAVLLGEFAIILLISGNAGKLSEVAGAQKELSAQTGLNIWIKQPSRKKPQEPSLPYKLVASCMDHPGIVYRISSVLSGLGINIESMETDTYSAPVSGTPIFRMEAVITVPARLNINSLRARLTEIENEENIDIDLALLSSQSSPS
jgi:glycine cleavage system transcriptional repressor